jgi:hypothetical protein
MRSSNKIRTSEKEKERCLPQRSLRIPRVFRDQK